MANFGLYHPALNPEGAKKADDSNFWHNTTTIFLSRADCFDPAKLLTASGTIASGVSGRPDGEFADAVYAKDVTDLRFSAREDDKGLDFWLNKAVANDLRYYQNEGVPFTVVYNDVDVEGSGTSGSTAELLISGIDSIALTGDFIVIYDDAVGFNRAGYRSSSAVGSLVRVAATLTDALAGTNDILATRTLGATYKVLVVEFQTHERETLSWTDVIGDPENYPRQWTGVIDFASDEGNQTVVTGQTIEIITGNEGDSPVGIVGNIYIRAGGSITGDLGTFPAYGNGTTWLNLGTKAEFLANAQGFEGFPLLFGEDGEDFIPDGSSKDFKLKRKSLITPIPAVTTADKGVTWSTANVNIDTTQNAQINSTLGGENVRLMQYQTPAHIFTDTVNAVVYDKDLSRVEAFSHNEAQFGSVLASNLISKVPVAASGRRDISLNEPEEFLYFLDELSTSSIAMPTHTPANLNGLVSPTAKAFTYKTDVNGQAQLNAVFKELIFSLPTINAWTTATTMNGAGMGVVGDTGFLDDSVFGGHFIVRDISLTSSSIQTRLDDGNLIEAQNGDLVWVPTGAIFLERRGNIDSTGAWGDDDQFVIADDTATDTDDNANTILLGTKGTPLPFFLREES